MASGPAPAPQLSAQTMAEAAAPPKWTRNSVVADLIGSEHFFMDWTRENIRSFDYKLFNRMFTEFIHHHSYKEDGVKLIGPISRIFECYAGIIEGGQTTSMQIEMLMRVIDYCQRLLKKNSVTADEFEGLEYLFSRVKTLIMCCVEESSIDEYGSFKKYIDLGPGGKKVIAIAKWWTLRLFSNLDKTKKALQKVIQMDGNNFVWLHYYALLLRKIRVTEDSRDEFGLPPPPSNEEVDAIVKSCRVAIRNNCSDNNLSKCYALYCRLLAEIWRNDEENALATLQHPKFRVTTRFPDYIFTSETELCSYIRRRSHMIHEGFHMMNEHLIYAEIFSEILPEKFRSYDYAVVILMHHIKVFPDIDGPASQMLRKVLQKSDEAKSKSPGPTVDESESPGKENVDPKWPKPPPRPPSSRCRRRASTPR